MKNYIIPKVYLLKIEDDLLISSKQKDLKDHCSACRWNFDGSESWHCDHSINNWTQEPFNSDCDYYE